MRKGKGLKKILIIGVSLIVVIGLVFFISLKSMLNNFSKEVSKIEVGSIDISNLKDGIYTGEYNLNDTVGAKVKVTVENNKISKIEFVEHKYGRGKRAEAITKRVIDNQSLDVDIISGATGSSRVILKSIENALVKE